MPFYKPQIPLQKPCTMHSEPPLDNPVPTMHDTNSRLPRLWPIVIAEVKPSLCQILTSWPVQSKAVPAERRARQWQLMPGGWDL